MDSNNLKQKAISGGLWVAAIGYGSNVINFASGLILARLLFKDDFGMFALALSIAEIIMICGGFSFAVSAIKHQELDDVFQTALGLSYLLAGVVFIVTAITTFFLTYFYSSDVCLAVLLIGFSRCLLLPSNILGATFERDFKFKQEALIRALCRAGASISCIILAYSFAGKWSLVAREIITSTVLFLLFFKFSNLSLKFSLNRATARKLWETSYQVFWLRAVEIIIYRTPNLIIGSVFGKGFLGMLERSHYLASLPNTALTPFTSKVAYPYFAKVRDPKAISEGIHISTFLIMRLLAPASLLLLLFPEWCVSFALGAKWAEAAPIVRYFSIYLLLMPVFELLKQAVIAGASPKYVTNAYLLNFAVLITTLLMVVTGIISPEMIALGFSCGMVAGCILLTSSAQKYSLTINWRKNFIGVMIATIIAGAVGMNLSSSFISVIILLSIWLIIMVVIDHKQITQAVKTIKS